MRYNVWGILTASQVSGTVAFLITLANIALASGFVIAVGALFHLGWSLI